jgi:hypothetical protein
MKIGDWRHMRSKRALDQAVAGVIEALLLVALAAIVLSTIQLVYIPDIMEQREADHMDQVDNQFSYLKSVIDLQTALAKDVPISSPITLGSKELPYFVTARAFGQLDIIESSSSYIEPIGASYGKKPLTSIQLEVWNCYYIGQRYVLEGGAVIVKQSDGESVKIEPSIIVENISGDTYITWQLPEFRSIAGKNSTSGYKNCFIRTNYTSNSEPGSEKIFTLKIYSEFLDAWNATFNTLLEEAIENGKVTVEKIPSATPPYVRIGDVEIDDYDLYLDINHIIIGVQIGPGIVVQ